MQCKIDAIPAFGRFGIMQQYIPTIAGTPQQTYKHNSTTKNIPYLKSKADAIKYGLKIVKQCELYTKKR